MFLGRALRLCVLQKTILPHIGLLCSCAAGAIQLCSNPVPYRNASVLSASLLWRDPTGQAMDGSSGTRDHLRSEALSLLEGMAAGLQVPIDLFTLSYGIWCSQYHVWHAVPLPAGAGSMLTAMLGSASRAVLS